MNDHDQQAPVGDSASSDRGRRAGFDPATGEVHGSGSGAGGGNPSEDYDGDPMAGGGSEPEGGPRSVDEGVSAPKDKHQGSYG